MTEMKRRFDVADQTAKSELAEAAKNVWQPDYRSDEERTKEQEEIRAISPQASQILEEMAKK